MFRVIVFAVELNELSSGGEEAVRLQPTSRLFVICVQNPAQSILS